MSVTPIWTSEQTEKAMRLFGYFNKVNTLPPEGVKKMLMDLKAKIKETECK